jgi:type IV secretory pathway VirD2 relaxase
LVSSGANSSRIQKCWEAPEEFREISESLWEDAKMRLLPELQKPMKVGLMAASNWLMMTGIASICREGRRTENEIRNALEKEIAAERWTRLDVEIRLAADETGAIDLRPENPGAADPEIRRLMIGRLQHLEKMGLAAPAGPGEWMVGLEAESNLRDLGMRGDIIKTMHRAFTERGEARGVADYVIDGEEPGSPIIGRLVDKGLHNELTGEAYAVIDGTDGRAHHVRLRGIEAFEHAPADRRHRRDQALRRTGRTATDVGARQPLRSRP